METWKHSLVAQLRTGETGEIEIEILGAFGVQIVTSKLKVQLEGSQKIGHPASLTASGAFSSPHTLTSLSRERLLSHLIHQGVKISSPTLSFKNLILS